jgi:hypothetical protein
VASVALIGCGDIPRGSVSGQVTLNERPLKEPVQLNFVGVDNLPMSTTTDVSGNYSLSGVPVGPIKVTVIPTQAGASGAKRGGRLVGRIKDKGNPGDSRRAQPAAAEVPVAYQDPAKPLITFEVKAGNNTFPIDLKSPPPK